MKTKSRPWFRMYVDAVEDDKLLLLAAEDCWQFVKLLCLKRSGILDSDAPQLDKRVALKMRLAPDVLIEVKRRLIEVGLIDDSYQPLGWNKRQFESDGTGAERMRKLREKGTSKRTSDSDVTADVTSRVTKSDAIDTETESDTESEYSPPASGSAEGAAQTRRPTRAAKRIPATWEPSTDLLAWASTEAPLVDLRNAFESIRDHEFKTAHRDWDAVVRNWLRRDQQRIEERMPRVRIVKPEAPQFRDDDDSMDGIEL